jgi:hypothetical protein
VILLRMSVESSCEKRRVTTSVSPILKNRHEIWSILGVDATSCIEFELTQTQHLSLGRGLSSSQL